MVSDFARVTGDDSFIHVDPEAASKTQYGGTVAHGLLLLSLLPRLMRDVAPLIRGTAMGANYGYEKVRFLSPVPTDSHIRAWFGLAAIEERQAHSLILRYRVSVEVEGQAKHALTADWLIARWMKRAADEVSRHAFRQDHSSGVL
jgi:acyl dehydratase